MNDTIAAIATPLSDAGIGIIRISGQDAVEVGDRLFTTPGGKHILKDVPSHTIHYGYLWEGQTKVDEVMVSVLRAPKSYTAEDTVEINCHGGLFVMQKILELVCHNGARLAEPGEFTKRAFLNGRIDLSGAEAVMDLIHSQNEIAMQSSIDQLSGKLSQIIRGLRENLIYEIAYIESALDDPEHFDLDGYSADLSKKITEIEIKIKHLSDSFHNGKMIKNGINTVILGKPNTGKSSLLNSLIGEDRSIVTDIEGTTRDTVHESIRLKGIHLNLIDTAGIRNTSDAVEKIGVEKAKKYAAEADLVIFVADTSRSLDENDREILSLILDKHVIVLLNKTDLEAVIDEQQIYDVIETICTEKNRVYNIDTFKRNFVILKTSTKDGTGMKELEDAVVNLFLAGDIHQKDEVLITNLRHKQALQDAENSLALVQQSIQDGMPEDFYTVDLMGAYRSLGLIIGEEVEDDLVEEIFSKFCMGK